MKRDIDCQVFHDRLEGLQRGDLAEEVAAQLREHAGTCPDCGMLLQLMERLAVPTREELEAAVPDAYVNSMWERVQSAVAVEDSEFRIGGRQARRWLVPTLAAASLFLLLATGLLVGELRRMREREQALVQQIAEHERWLTELDLRTRSDLVARTAGLVGSQAWERLLARRERVSIGDLEALLARLPARATVLSAAEWQGLQGTLPLWFGSVWGSAMEAVEAEDGVQAAELLDVLAALDLEPDRRISMARLLALKRATGPGRL